jgi:hypothetical protein
LAVCVRALQSCEARGFRKNGSVRAMHGDAVCV